MEMVTGIWTVSDAQLGERPPYLPLMPIKDKFECIKASIAPGPSKIYGETYVMGVKPLKAYHL